MYNKSINVHRHTMYGDFKEMSCYYIVPQTTNHKNMFSTITRVTIVLFLMIVDSVCGEINNTKKLQVVVKKISRTRYGQDEFLLSSIPSQSDTDGRIVCTNQEGESLCYNFFASPVGNRHDNCHCRCETDKNTFLLSSRKCESNNKGKLL